jgi:hypothetical protein
MVLFTEKYHHIKTKHLKESDVLLILNCDVRRKVVNIVLLQHLIQRKWPKYSMGIGKEF